MSSLLHFLAILAMAAVIGGLATVGAAVVAQTAFAVVMTACLLAIPAMMLDGVINPDAFIVGAR